MILWIEDSVQFVTDDLCLGLTLDIGDFLSGMTLKQFELVESLDIFDEWVDDGICVIFIINSNFADNFLT